MRDAHVVDRRVDEGEVGSEARGDRRQPAPRGVRAEPVPDLKAGRSDAPVQSDGRIRPEFYAQLQAIGAAMKSAK